MPLEGTAVAPKPTELANQTGPKPEAAGTDGAEQPGLKDRLLKKPEDARRLRLKHVIGNGVRETGSNVHKTLKAIARTAGNLLAPKDPNLVKDPNTGEYQPKADPTDAVETSMREQTAQAVLAGENPGDIIADQAQDYLQNQPDTTIDTTADEPTSTDVIRPAQKKDGYLQGVRNRAHKLHRGITALKHPGVALIQRTNSKILKTGAWIRHPRASSILRRPKDNAPKPTATTPEAKAGPNK